MVRENLTILEVISKSSQYLKKKGITRYKTDAEWLVAFALECKRMDLYLRFGEVLGDDALDAIKKLVIERGKRIPLQHILGEVHFAGLTLKCDRRALVPRFETEFLVDYIHNQLSSAFSGKIADLGCGGGAISLSLGALLPNAQVWGLDKSPSALELANENLSFSKLQGQVFFEEFDWLANSSLSDSYDLIVCNPPYLTEQEWQETEPEVQLHDPKEALISQKNGLSDLAHVVRIASKSLDKNGLLALEFGLNQADAVEQLLIQSFDVEILKDQYLVRRFAYATKR
jgi:release factor glutamine methyltransferase